MTRRQILDVLAEVVHKDPTTALHLVAEIVDHELAADDAITYQRGTDVDVQPVPDYVEGWTCTGRAA